MCMILQCAFFLLGPLFANALDRGWDRPGRLLGAEAASDDEPRLNCMASKHHKRASPFHGEVVVSRQPDHLCLLILCFSLIPRITPHYIKYSSYRTIWIQAHSST